MKATLHWRLFPVAFVVLVLGGCNENNSWYDFGNGMINLERVEIITSNADVSVAISPKLTVNYNSTDRERALYVAHKKFCEQAHDGETRVSGSIPTVDRELSAFTDSLVMLGTAEILENCSVTISGRATIKFDDFTLRLSAVDINLDSVSVGGKDEDSQNEIREMLISQGLYTTSPWGADYREVQKAAKSAGKML